MSFEKKLKKFDNNVVVFKSIPENFVKEKSGIKNNTVRLIDESNERFIALRNDCKNIGIVCTVGKDFFFRKVSDYTEWNGRSIITFINNNRLDRERMKKGLAFVRTLMLYDEGTCKAIEKELEL